MKTWQMLAPLACAVARALAAQAGPVNPGFENGEPGKPPPGWFLPQQGAGYSAEVRHEGCHGGAGCAVLIAPATPAPSGFGTLMQMIDAAPYRGAHIRLRAWLRVEATGPDDKAQLWIRVDRPNRQMGFFDNMQDRPVRSADWTACDIEGDVDEDAQQIGLGLISIGKGKTWIDDVSLQIVPDASVQPTPEDRRSLEGLYADRPQTKIISIRVRGEEATVTTDSRVVVASYGNETATDNFARDTWARTPGGWTLKDSTLLSSHPVLQPTSAAATAAIAGDLKRYAAPLKSVQAGSGFEDLAAFGKAVGDARIVALGEASHGTSEFFRMKHRLLEYLVKETGFTVFAIEANWPESLAVDRYIATGEGDPKAALAGMYFWTWNTQEVLDMIEWMRAYNKAAGRPALTFTSFDMQTGAVATRRAMDYLARIGPEYAKSAESMRPEKVVKLFDDNRAGFIMLSSAAEWREARQAAEVARQAAALKASGFSYRDEMMARNVEWLSETYPKQKMVLWAHNYHVSANRQGAKSMGAWLRDRFGAQMYTVGFAFRRGEVRAVGRQNSSNTRLGAWPAPPLPDGSGDAVLSAAGMPLFFLDFHAVPRDAALAGWLDAPHLFRQAGAIWQIDAAQANAQTATLAELYDGLIFVEESHAAAGLPRPANQ